MTANLTAPRPLPRTENPTDKAAIAAGYRHLADLIESGQVPIPMNIHVGLNPRLLGEDEAAITRDAIRALGGGTWAKDTSVIGYLVMRGMCAGLPIDIWLDRAAVCERRVIGTRKVTDTVPVGEDTRPVETVTRTEDVVEWVCSPLLAAADETPAAVQA